MKTIKKILVGLLLTITVTSLSSCDKDNDGDGSGSSRGTVWVDNVTLGDKVSGHYKVYVTVKASGISASDVESIGFYYGKNSDCNDFGRKSSGTLYLNKSVDCYSGRYYFKAFLKENGKSRKWSSSTKSIRVP